jgi:TPR repeat protein
MTDQNNLPAKTTTANVAVPTEQSGSLVARGLEAVRSRSKQALSLPSEADLEKLFRDACDRGDYETALRIIHSLANRGSVLAEELCDDLYAEVTSDVFFEGDNKDRDVAVVTCLRKAAEQGDALAQSMLGSLYCNGSWVDEEAMKWIRKAAERDFQYAQFSYRAICCHIIIEKSDNRDLILFVEQREHPRHFTFELEASSGRLHISSNLTNAIIDEARTRQ